MIESDYDQEPDYEDELREERPRDSKVDEAKEYVLGEVFGKDPGRVFYGRQIEVMIERQFFHWITTAALKELVAEGVLQSEKLGIRAGLEARFYWAKGVRYWRREATKIGNLIRRYSTEDVSRALGDHGEMMFGAALPKFGFMPVASDATEYKGKKWTETGHNLDRIFERDAVGYGAEIKNTLDYIEREELETKIAMCKELGLRPLFIFKICAQELHREDHSIRRVCDDLRVAALSAWVHGVGEGPEGAVGAQGGYAATDQGRHDTAVFELAYQTGEGSRRVGECELGRGFTPDSV